MWFRRTRTEALDCREVGRILQRFLDHELEDADAALVSRHLRDCRRCGLNAQAYADIKSALGARPATVRTDQVQRLQAFAEGLMANGPNPHNPPEGESDAESA